MFKQIGITHRISCPHTHQQNGCVERKHRHIIESALALLAHSSLPTSFWDDACLTACYLINRMPTPNLGHQSPFQKLFHQEPDYKFLKVFGCACYPHLRPYNNNKLQFCSLQCIFLGYSSHHKGYKCLHIPTGRIYISRDVVFDEFTFPFANKTLSPTSLQPNTSNIVPLSITVPLTSLQVANTSSTSYLTSQTNNTNRSCSDHARISDASPTSSSSNHTAPPSVQSSVSAPLRTHPMVTRSQNLITKPKQFHDGIVQYPVPRALMSLMSPSEPTCYSTAAKFPEWRTAMEAEFNALLKNNTWSLVPPSRACNIVGYKWVF